MNPNPIDECLEATLNKKKHLQLYREICRYSDILQNQNSLKNMIDFSSNDYLNLRRNSAIINAGFQSAKKSGAGTGASRLVIQTDQIIDKLEKTIAEKLNFNHAIFLSSGFSANITFFEGLSSLTDIEIFIDHRAHASLFFGVRAAKIPFQIYRHDNFIHLETKLAASKEKIKIIISESIHSMDGTILNGERLKSVCDRHQAHIFLDDSHGFGVLGAQGKGFLEVYPYLIKNILAISFGCGKSVGVSGGFLLTNSFQFKESLIQNSKQIMFSTGISPFITGAVLQSIKIIFSEEGAKKRMHLFQNIKTLIELIQPYISTSLSSSPIIPVILKTNQDAYKASKSLISQGLLVKCMRPPSVPKNTSRLRLSLNTALNTPQILKLFSALKKEFKW